MLSTTYVKEVLVSRGRNRIRFTTQCVNSRANKPHGVQYIAVSRDPQQFIRHSDRVHVTMLAVVKISIGTPNPLEHFNAEAERVDRAQKA